MKIEGLKLTKVQKEVVNRLKEGQKLAILSTDRISGDAYFWVRENERGYHRIVDKALYPSYVNYSDFTLSKKAKS